MLETPRLNDYLDVSSSPGAVKRENLYRSAVEEHGKALDRLAAGYEANSERRLDLRQDIHLQLWRSLESYDGRCSLRTWVFRVAHNTASSYVSRERRKRAPLVSLEEIEEALPGKDAPPDVDQQRALEHLTQMILKLKPLDRQIMISYLEEMDASAIAEITGLSAANVAMKIHRIKSLLSRRFAEEQRHA